MRPGFLSDLSFLLIGALLVGAAAACAPAAASPAPGTAPTPAATSAPITPTPTLPASGKVGDTLGNDIWQMTLTSVERPGAHLEWTTPAGSPIPSGEADAQGEFLLAYLDARNIQVGDPRRLRGSSLSLPDFQLVGPDGVKSYPALNCCAGYATSRGMRPVTFGSDVPLGGGSRFLLFFDVPPGATGLQLRYTPGRVLVWQLP